MSSPVHNDLQIHQQNSDTEIRWIHRSDFATFVKTHKHFCTYMPSNYRNLFHDYICCSPVNPNQHSKSLKDQRCEKCLGKKGRFTFQFEDLDDSPLWLSPLDFIRIKEKNPQNTYCTYMSIKQSTRNLICSRNINRSIDISHFDRCPLHSDKFPLKSR